jgi:hypothetical protein
MGEANLFVVTFLAVVFGLFVGAVLIVVTTPATLHAWGNAGSAPGHALSVTFSTLGNAYGALFTGSIVSPSALGHAISTGSGWTSVLSPISWLVPGWRSAFRPACSTSVVKASSWPGRSRPPM